MDSGYLYFLELVDTQVIIRLRLCILTRAMNPLAFCVPEPNILSNMKVQDTSPAPANNVASFKDILILDHDLNSNDGTASNNHHPHNGSNLN